MPKRSDTPSMRLSPTVCLQCHASNCLVPSKKEARMQRAMEAKLSLNASDDAETERPADRIRERSEQYTDYIADESYQSDEKLPDTEPDEAGPLGAAAYPESPTVGAGLDAAQQGRAAWGGQLEFFLTCVGYAVGLGNVWRFPYLCYKNGGGAFLLPYCLMLALVGLPCFFMELSFGQFASLGPLTIWRVSPLFKGLGVAMVMVSLILSVYYNVIVAQCLLFLAFSFTSRLPWQHCGQAWNSPMCREFHPDSGNSSEMVVAEESGINETAVATNFTDSFCSFDSRNVSTMCRAPSEEFYERFILLLTPGIEDLGQFNWRLALALLAAWALVALVLVRGVQSLGKVSYFTAVFPYLMLVALLIRGASLPGSSRGVLFYLTPTWSRLLDYRVWMEAATQIFFSLSCCNGGLIAMSSYSGFRNNCQRDAVLVALVNCGTSVFAGFVIFCNLGFMSYKKDVPVAEVAQGGPGLAFVVYPEALTHMPLAPLWSVLFFVMMATLGFGSQFSITETVLCAFQDELRSLGAMGASRTRSAVFRVAVCAALFALGLSMTCGSGMYLLNLVDNAVSTFPLLVCGLVELLVLMYIYPYRQFAEDICLMVGERPNAYWRVTWLFLTPFVLLTLLVLMAAFNEPVRYGTYTYSQPYQTMSILIGVLVIAWIPGYAGYRFCREGGCLLLRELLKPVEGWGPARTMYRDQFLGSLHAGSAFFQSKLSVAAEMQRAASRESGLNRIRTGASAAEQMEMQPLPPQPFAAASVEEKRTKHEETAAGRQTEI